MPFVSLDIYGAERARGTQVLASSAPDALFGVDSRNLNRFFVVRIRRDHRYRANRAVAFAVSASHAVGQRYAVLLDPNGMADLD